MNINEIKELINSPEYSFLKDNPHLKDRLVFLTLGGSYAYGTNVETSDIDVRGCALNSPSDILGLSNFEQFIDEKTDTVIYSFNKLINLLINCNPNTIELLGGRPESYIYLSDIGKEFLENRSLFLSQRAVNSFGGYATQQLRRLESALARDRLSDELKEKHIANALERSTKAFEDKFTRFENGAIILSTGKRNESSDNTEVLCNIHIDKYPAREFQTLLNTLSSVVGTYDKLNCRNKKKDDAHLNKHAMHLIRLYLMCLDILEKGEINTYRPEREFLLEIRNGKYMLEDGTYMPEFFEMVNDFEKRIAYAKENTSLPYSPDIKKIEEFVMDVNKKSIS